jgi:hypothetical protein
MMTKLNPHQHAIICDLQAELAAKDREIVMLREYKEMAVKREQALRNKLNAARIKEPKWK